MVAPVTFASSPIVFQFSRSLTPARKTLLAALLATTVVAAFAYLYFREWWVKRGFRKYCLDRQHAQAAASIQSPLPARERKPLLQASNAPDTTAARTPRESHRAHWTVTAESDPEVPPPKRTGTLHVCGHDFSCDLFIDGAFCGNPPATLKLAEGPHLIEIRRAGHKEYCREIHMVNGSELNLRAPPEADPTPPT